MLVQKGADGRPSVLVGPNGKRVVLKQAAAPPKAKDDEVRAPERPKNDASEGGDPKARRDPNRQTMRSTAVNVVPASELSAVVRRATMRSTAVNIAPINIS